MGKTPLVIKDIKEEKNVKDMLAPTPSTTNQAAGKNVFFTTPKEELQTAINRLKAATTDSERLLALIDIGNIYQQNNGVVPYPFDINDVRGTLQTILVYALKKEGVSDEVRQNAMYCLSAQVIGSAKSIMQPSDLAIILPEMCSIAASASLSPYLRANALENLGRLVDSGLLLPSDQSFNQIMSCIETILHQTGLDQELVSQCAGLVSNIVGSDLPNTQRLLGRANSLISLMGSILNATTSRFENIYQMMGGALIDIVVVSLKTKNYISLSASAIDKIASISKDIFTNASYSDEFRIHAGRVLFSIGLATPGLLGYGPLQVLSLDSNTASHIRAELPGEPNTWGATIASMSSLTFHTPNGGIIKTLYENYNIIQFSLYDRAILESMYHNLTTKTGKPIIFAVITRKPDEINFASIYSEADLSKFDIRFIEPKNEDVLLQLLERITFNLSIKPYSEDPNGPKLSYLYVGTHGQSTRMRLSGESEDEKSFLDVSDKDLAKKIGDYFKWKKMEGTFYNGTTHLSGCAVSGESGTISPNIAEIWAQNTEMKVFGAQVAYSGSPTQFYSIVNGEWSITNVKITGVNRNSYDYRNTTTLNGDFSVLQKDLSVEIKFNFTESPSESQFILEGYDIERSIDGGKIFERVGFLSPGQKSFVDNGMPAGILTYRVKQRWYKNVGVDGIGTYPESRDYQFGFSQSKSIEFKGVEVPTTLTLHQNYPNPFNSTTNIQYYLPKSGKVTMKVYDMLGREVSTLVSEDQKMGEHLTVFNAASLASGTYFCTLVVEGKSGTSTQKIKMVLVK